MNACPKCAIIPHDYAGCTRCERDKIAYPSSMTARVMAGVILVCYAIMVWSSV